jgi:hypothetical protein
MSQEQVNHLPILVGDTVVYHDTKGLPHNALVTANWGGSDHPLLNLVFVSGNEDRTDNFGRQIERETSVPHKSFGVLGRYWRRADEAPNPMTPPVSL